MAEPKPAKKKATKAKETKLAARHHHDYKISGCCEKGNCQNCWSRNCTHFCHKNSEG